MAGSVATRFWRSCAKLKSFKEGVATTDEVIVVAAASVVRDEGTTGMRVREITIVWSLDRLCFSSKVRTAIGRTLAMALEREMEGRRD